MARYWYAYISGDARQASSYQLLNYTPPCGHGCSLCAIYVPAGGSQPQPLTPHIKRYIAAALATCVEQPATPVNAIKYVLLKPN